MVLDETRTCKRHRRKRSYYRVRGATKQVNPISNYYRSLCWCYQPPGVPKWYIKYDDGNFTCCLIYMGVNCACKTLAMPFMQWAPWETIHWFKITEILSSLWNKIGRGVEKIHRLTIRSTRESFCGASRRVTSACGLAQTSNFRREPEKWENDILKYLTS